MSVSKTCVDVVGGFGTGIVSVLIAVSMLSAYQKQINFVSNMLVSSMLIFSGLPECDNSLPEPHWCQWCYVTIPPKDFLWIYFLGFLIALKITQYCLVLFQATSLSLMNLWRAGGI